MANDDGNIKSKKKESSTASLSRSIDTSGLRRSTRETPLNQSNARRSEQIETQTTPTPSPVEKKPDKIEEQMGPSSLRRSDRSKKQLSTDASGSKKLVELPVSLSPIIKSKKEKTASSPKEDAGDVSAENKSDSKNEGHDPDIGGRKRKRMTVRGYKSLFNPQRLRIEAEDGQHSHESGRITESGNVEKQIGGKCSQDNDGNMMTQNMAIDACEDNDKQISPKSPSSQCKKHGEGEQIMAIDACEDNDKQISPKSPSSECKKHGDDEQRTTESGNGDKQIGGKCSQDNNGNMMTQSMDIDACEDNDKQISPKSPSLEGKKHGNDEQSINDDLTNHQDLDSHNNSCDKNLPEAPATKVRKTSCEEAAVMVMENTENNHHHHNNNNNDNNNNNSKFVEFWVPIEISNVQLEQYCSSLLSNAVALCSLSKISDSLGALHDLFISNRKCCNHPYIVNTALLDSVKKDQPEWSWDLHYRVSGKLHFLDLILPEVKKRQQRVVILLQPQGGSSSKCPIIGNILDEFIVQRFGEDSLSRVDMTGSNRSIQKSVSNTFNTDMNKFIFMLDSTTCHSTIKLSSVDIIIIFDSDLNPANDIKSLHKISIDSNPNQIMVFRLYSKNTLEEKILKLAQDNVVVDTKLQDLKKSTSDALLMWGAKDLFQKLSLFHGISEKDITSEEDFFKNVMNEFLYIISNKCNDTGRESVITKVDICGSYGDKTKPYSEIKTQLLDGEEPHVFWRNLLDGRYPLWKFVAVSTSRQRKRPIYYGDKSDKTTPVAVADVAVKKRKKSLALKAVVEKETEGGHNESEPSSGDEYWIPTVNNAKSLPDDILKPTVYKLCNILNFPVDVKNTVESFLDYVLEKYLVSEDHKRTLQAFMISLCWIGASLSTHKLDKTKTFDLAKNHLNFDCEEEEAKTCYKKLKEAKEMFLKQNQNQENHDDFKETESTEQKTSLESQHNENVDVSENQELVNEERFGIIEKQSEEIERFNKEWDEKRENLENDYKLEIALIRTIHTNQSVRSEKLQSLDKELAIKLEEHERNKEIQLKNLKSTILTANTETSVSVGNPDDKMTEMPSELDGCRDQDQFKEKGSLGIGDDIESTGSQTSEKQIVDATVSSVPSVEVPPRQHDGTVDDDVAVVLNGEVPAQQSDGVVGNDVAGDVECVGVEILEVESNKENGKGESSGADVAVHVPGGDEEKENGEDGNKDPGKSQDVEEQNDSCGSSSSNQPPAGAPHEDTPSAPVQQSVSQPSDHPMPTILETESDSLLEELLELGIQEKEGEAADPISFPEINPEEPNPANEVVPCENDANAPELLTCNQNSVPPEIPNQTTSQPPENEINTQHPANCENDANAPEPPEINMFDVQVASRVPNHGDPLQAELERLCVVKNTVTKSHEDTKQNLKVECEKEIAEMIAQIKLKYEGKCKEAETAFHKRKREIDTTFKKIVMNKMLAEAFRAKCKDLTPSGPDSSPARLMQKFHRVSFRPSSSLGQSSGVQQTPPPPPPPQPPVPPPLQIVDQPAALFSTPLIRPPPSTINPVTPTTRPPPTITPTTRPPPAITPTTRPPPAITPTTRPPPAITPLAGTLRGPAPHLRQLVNGDVRAPAPHMRAFKPSTSASPDFTYRSRRVPPGQHVTTTLNSQPTTSVQVQPPPPLPPQSTPPPTPPPPQVPESGGGEWELDPTGIILLGDDARPSSGQDLVYLSDDD